ncbi:MAG: sulfatase [Bacteroidia bacterium]|nr:sulfatase [Bacteroidia bacterium]
MKLLRRILIAIFLLFSLLLGGLVFFIKKNSFQVEAWEFPEQMEASASVDARPNILLLVAEDMSDRVGAFRDNVAHTPNIDRLAEKGVRFPNTFTTAGVCSPSRAALITGMMQTQIASHHMRTGSRPEGAYTSVPPPEVKAFPELLRKAGYFTFNTAKQDYQFSGAFPGSGPFTIWDEENESKLWRNRETGQPFFGMMNFMETHETGLFAPLGTKPHGAMHLGIQLFRKLSSQEAVVQTDPAKVELPPYFPDTEIVRKDIAKHYNNISAMDAIVGDILDKLEKDGLTDNTIIIWTTDHGDCLPRSKRELYDSGIKVPMIVYVPPRWRNEGYQAGGIDSSLVSFIDLAPSILKMADAAVPDFIEGQDFLSPDTSRTYILAARDRIDEVPDRQRAIRDKRFKYIRSWHPEQEGGHPLAFRDNLDIMRELWQLKDAGKLNAEQLRWFEAPGEERLFDTWTDPFELKDLSQDTAYQEDLHRLRSALKEYLASHKDWGEIAEGDMVEEFHPGGKTPKTKAPLIQEDGGKITIESSIEGASIAYRINEGKWKLYHEALNMEGVTKIMAKAVRYGWEESEEIQLEVGK